MNVIVIGATSGIGKALVELYASKGYTVGATGRRKELLDELQRAYPTNLHTKAFDVLGDDSTDRLQELIDEMGGYIDLAIISAGVGHINRTLDWELECITAQTNVMAFTRLAGYLYAHFKMQGKGQLAAISSIASIRGIDLCPSYSASKAYMAIYLEALRRKSVKEKNRSIRVSTILPGFIDTAFLGDSTPSFWLADVHATARQIARGLKRKRRKIYVPYRWKWVAMLLRRMPSGLYERL